MRRSHLEERHQLEIRAGRGQFRLFTLKSLLSLKSLLIFQYRFVLKQLVWNYTKHPRVPGQECN
jgi:hypothetical protein